MQGLTGCAVAAIDRWKVAFRQLPVSGSPKIVLCGERPDMGSTYARTHSHKVWSVGKFGNRLTD